MNNTVISPVYPMLIQKYNTLIPDPNVNVLDKINSIVDYLNQTGKLTNDVVDQWNKVMAWAMNDGLNTDVSNKLETMLSNGEFDTLFQKYIAPSLGDISTLQTADKSSAVNAINEVDQLAKANQTNLGTLSNLTTTDKSSLVNAVNESDTLSKTNQTNIGTLSNLQTSHKTDLVSAVNDNVAQLSSTTSNLIARGINIKYPMGTSLTPCLMDGVTDDSTSFQAIVNYANTNQIPVFIPPSTTALKLISSILIPTTLTFVGMHDIGMSGVPTSQINSSANPVFKPVNYTGTKIQTTFNLYKVQIHTNQNCDAFLGFNFYNSIHEGLDVQYANNAYNNCQLSQLSHVRFSQFYQIYTSFLIGQIVDSYIHHNYIDGNTANNTSIAFQLSYPATCWIHHNYFDFWDQVFVLSNGGDHWTISDNIFDYCRVGITGTVQNGIIANNKGHQLTTTSSSKWPTPNANMSNPWYMMGGSNNWANVRIKGNEADTTDILMNFYQYGSFNNVYSEGNSNNGGTLINYLSSADPSNVNANKNIYFQELMYKSYASLPDPRVFINANVVVSFLGQIIKYNGALWHNDNEQWRMLNGDDQGTAAPTSGTYNQGMKVWNTAPSSTTPMGWICTVSGTLTSISTTCTATGNNVVTVASLGGLKVGQYISINGGAALQIQSINYSNSQITMSGNVASGSSLTFANSPATFIAMANA